MFSLAVTFCDLCCLLRQSPIANQRDWGSQMVVICLSIDGWSKFTHQSRPHQTSCCVTENTKIPQQRLIICPFSCMSVLKKTSFQIWFCGAKYTNLESFNIVMCTVCVFGLNMQHMRRVFYEDRMKTESSTNEIIDFGF